MAPKLEPQMCGEAVCLSVAEVKALVQYKHAVDDMNAAVTRCSLVEVAK